jgi:hypothetical protein
MRKNRLRTGLQTMLPCSIFVYRCLNSEKRRPIYTSYTSEIANNLSQTRARRIEAICSSDDFSALFMCFFNNARFVNTRKQFLRSALYNSYPNRSTAHTTSSLLTAKVETVKITDMLRWNDTNRKLHCAVGARNKFKQAEHVSECAGLYIYSLELLNKTN